jgi:N-acetylmuramoyl-L-alanine amidase
MELINNILIGQNIKHIESDSFLGSIEILKPELIIIQSEETKKFKSHFNSNNRPSVHIKVDRDGLVTQLIPFNLKGSEVLQGYWEGDSNLASKSITIQLENAGKLRKSGNEYISDSGEKFEAHDVFAGVHQNEDETSYWQKYTEKQVFMAEQLCRLLLMSYQVKYILGNEEISPGLNVDPGPAFPLERLRNNVFSEISQRTIVEPAFSFDSEIKGESNYAMMLNETFLRDTENKGKIINIRPKSGGWYKLNIDLGGCIKEEWVKI